MSICHKYIQFLFVAKRHIYYFYPMDLQSFFEQGQNIFLPNISIDLVILGYDGEKIKCLLLQLQRKWMLPGGYVYQNEAVNEAAKRLLKERTDLTKPHLSFLTIMGQPNRFFSHQFEEFAKKEGIAWSKDYWVNQRFVSLTYYSLVNMNDLNPKKNDFDDAIDWFDVRNLPSMWMDHESIIQKAQEQLKLDAKEPRLPVFLLEKEFTMPELHQLHQTILEEEIDRSRFQKKMLASGLFERLPKVRNDSVGRNPFRYRIKVE